MDLDRDKNMEQQQTKEDKAVILDFLPHGYAQDTGALKSPIAQGLGTAHLTLLELIPKKDVHLQPHQEVYIGEGRRDEIHHIKGRIGPDRLTSTAEKELKHVVIKLVEDNEQKFIKFFNEARPLSMRMHQLELLPGLGKKHMWEVLNERKGKPFTGFDDLKERVNLLPDPKLVVVKRILSELLKEEKYKIFVG
jgi:putative nucleotide binding protein